MNDMGRSPRYASAGDCGLPLLGGARPDFSVRSRDLFPLPVPPRLESTSGLSRRSSQRLCRKVRKMDTVREAVHGLNWLAGHGFLHDSETPPDDLQAEVLQIHLLAQDSGNLGSLERVPSSEAALQALLKGKSEYHQPSTPVALAPYKLERVSLPEDLHGLPQAVDLLPQDARRYLQGKELMVKEGEPLEAPPPYWDPALAKSKKQYRQFIQIQLWSETRVSRWFSGASKSGAGRPLGFLWAVVAPRPDDFSPLGLVEKECWAPKLWGKWQFPEGIITLEVAEPRRGHLHTRHLTAEEIALQPRSLEVFTQED